MPSSESLPHLLPDQTLVLRIIYEWCIDGRERFELNGCRPGENPTASQLAQAIDAEAATATRTQAHTIERVHKNLLALELETPTEQVDGILRGLKGLGLIESGGAYWFNGAFQLHDGRRLTIAHELKRESGILVAWVTYWIDGTSKQSGTERMELSDPSSAFYQLTKPYGIAVAQSLYLQHLTQFVQPAKSAILDTLKMLDTVPSYRETLPKLIWPDVSSRADALRTRLQKPVRELAYEELWTLASKLEIPRQAFRMAIDELKASCAIFESKTFKTAFYRIATSQLDAIAVRATTVTPKKRRGPKQVFDHKQDQRIYEARKESPRTRWIEIGRLFDMTGNEARKAHERHKSKLARLASRDQFAPKEK